MNHEYPKIETKNDNGEVKIALIGLGYVGLPLAVEFGKKFDTVGFDVKTGRNEAQKFICNINEGSI